MADMKHVPVPYPTVDQGMHSVRHLINAAVGSEPADRNTLIAHGWVGSGSGFGQLFPTDGGMQAVDLTDVEKQALGKFVEMEADPAAVGAAAWRETVKVILVLLLRLLGCLLLVVAFQADTAVAEQAPRPPQAPAPPAGSADYSAAYQSAVREGRTLYVWVGYKCPSSANQLSEAVHVFVDSFRGSTVQRVVVGVPDGVGGLDRVGEVLAPDCCAAELERVARRVPLVARSPQPRMAKHGACAT